jgi:hypothetical protein
MKIKKYFDNVMLELTLSKKQWQWLKKAVDLSLFSPHIIRRKQVPNLIV